MTAAGVIHQYAFGDLRCRIVVLRIFTSYANGTPLTRIVKTLNEESVPGAIRAAKGWSPATISRILDSEKYAGRWVWNKTESRRDPKAAGAGASTSPSRNGSSEKRGATDRPGRVVEGSP